MDIESYLQRIGYRGSLDPTLDTLRGLHREHMLSVPFENLDIHLRRPITLDTERFFDKMVTRRRGGFCYELNGLFAALLRQLGFDVTLHSARVYNSERGAFGSEFDHMILLVQLEERWLADVGFGDSFREPLRLEDPNKQAQNDEAYRLARDGVEWRMMGPGADGKMADSYAFTLQPRQLADFAPMCHYQQTSPESTFTQKRICTRATRGGRITLSNMRLIVTTNGERYEKVLADDAEYAAVLLERFGIIIPPPTSSSSPPTLSLRSRRH